jgi:hypothetical protein
MNCGRCGKRAVGRVDARWCVCGWSEDAHSGTGAVDDRPSQGRRTDLYPNSGRPWTPNELAFVYRNRDRLSLRAMADRLKRSPHSVEQKCHKLKWRKRWVISDEPKVKARARWSDGELMAVLSGSIVSNRSTSAVRAKLRREGEGGLRRLDGMLSAADVAREYGCSVHRVSAMRQRGLLAAVWRYHSWRFDPDDCERLRVELTAPKQTWRGSPPDFADYDQRYGLRRVPRTGQRVPRC